MRRTSRFVVPCLVLALAPAAFADGWTTPPPGGAPAPGYPVPPPPPRDVVVPVPSAPPPPAAVVAAPCPPPDPCETCLPKGWVRRFGAALSLQKGNSDNFDLKLDGEVERKPDPWGGRVALAFVYGETDGDRTAENWHGLARVDRKLGSRAYVFSEVLFDRDVPADLEYRFTGVLGVGRTFIDNGRDLLKGEVGLGGVVEKRVDFERTIDPTAYLGARYEHCWGEGTRVFADLKVLPNLEDFDLTRTTFEAGYECPICKWLKGTVGVRVDWVANPPGDDIEPVDVLITAGLKAEF